MSNTESSLDSQPETPTTSELELEQDPICGDRPPYVYEDPDDDTRDIFVDFDPDYLWDEEEQQSEVDVDLNLDSDSEPRVRGDEARSSTSTSTSTSTEAATESLAAPHPHAPASPVAQLEDIKLIDLLESPNAPGRSLYSHEQDLEREEASLRSLRETMCLLEAEIKRAERDEEMTRSKVSRAASNFQALRLSAGISDKLWQEYETFCESLEPKFGSRGAWSVICFNDHQGSYVGYDPDLKLFKESTEMPLGACNFRCEAGRIAQRGNVHSEAGRIGTCRDTWDRHNFHDPLGQGWSGDYVVEFWPIASPVPRTDTASTWGDQYPDLYHMAVQAASDSAQFEDGVAAQLLKSLPGQDASFAGGWLFEYHPEPGRSEHSIISRRWSYRSAHKINSPDNEGSEAQAQTQAQHQAQTHVSAEDGYEGSATDQDLEKALGTKDCKGMENDHDIEDGHNIEEHVDTDAEMLDAE